MFSKLLVYGILYLEYNSKCSAYNDYAFYPMVGIQNLATIDLLDFYQ